MPSTITPAPKQTKHIFVTGGVVSSLGKGLTCASIGMLLEHRGLFQFALRGERDQRLVRKAAPQEKRETRRELEITKAIDVGGIATR